MIPSNQPKSLSQSTQPTAIKINEFFVEVQMIWLVFLGNRNNNGDDEKETSFVDDKRTNDFVFIVFLEIFC